MLQVSVMLLQDLGCLIAFLFRVPTVGSECSAGFFKALQELWKNISDNDFVYSTDLKNFRRNYFDCIMRKFTPDSRGWKRNNWVSLIHYSINFFQSYSLFLFQFCSIFIIPFRVCRVTYVASTLQFHQLCIQD